VGLQELMTVGPSQQRGGIRRCLITSKAHGTCSIYPMMCCESKQVEWRLLVNDLVYSFPVLI
jgi:hypothetical protein